MYIPHKQSSSGELCYQFVYLPLQTIWRDAPPLKVSGLYLGPISHLWERSQSLSTEHLSLNLVPSQVEAKSALSCLYKLQPAAKMILSTL